MHKPLSHRTQPKPTIFPNYFLLRIPSYRETPQITQSSPNRRTIRVQNNVPGANSKETVTLSRSNSITLFHFEDRAARNGVVGGTANRHRNPATRYLICVRGGGVRLHRVPSPFEVGCLMVGSPGMVDARRRRRLRSGRWKLHGNTGREEKVAQDTL